MADIKAVKVDGTKYPIKIPSENVKSMTGYSKGSSTSAIQTSDTLNSAIGKLECRADKNQTNILYTLGKTGKNLFQINMDEVRKHNTSGTWSGNNYTANGVTLTFNADGTISTTGTATARTTIVLDTYIPANNRFQSLNGLILSGCPTGGAWNRYALKLVMTDSPYSVAAQDTGSGATIDTTAIPTTANLAALYLDIYANYLTSASTFKPMFCTQEDWNASHEYASYRGIPNSDLTRLEAEDRAALAEEIDAGAKNLFDLLSIEDLKKLNTSGVWTNNQYVLDGVTFTVDESTKMIRTSGTSTTSSYTVFNLYLFTAPGSTQYADYILSGCPSGGNYETGYCILTVNDNGSTLDKDIGNGVVIGTGAIRRIRIGCRAGTNMSNKTFKPMLCTLADWKVSQKFVPYRVPITGVMSVVDKEVACSTTLTTTGIKFTATEKGVYRITATAIYYNSFPMKLAIKHKISPSMSQGTLCTAVHVENEDVSLTVSGIRLLDVGGELELFAQYSSSTNNRFYVLVEKIG